MNWFDILKNAKLSGKTKGTTGTLDTSRIKIDTDDNCKEELFNWLKSKNPKSGTDWDVSEKSCCELIKWIKSTTFSPALQRFIDMGAREFVRYLYGKEPTIYIGVFNSTDKDMHAELTMQGSNNPNSNTFLTLRIRARVKGRDITGYNTMLKNHFDYRDFMHWDMDMPQEAFIKKLWKDIRFEW